MSTANIEFDIAQATIANIGKNAQSALTAWQKNYGLLDEEAQKQFLQIERRMRLEQAIDHNMFGSET